MSLAARRRQLVANITVHLSEEGWSEKRIADLPEEVKTALEWSPEKQFSNSKDEYILLEVENELGIPPWLVRTLRTNQTTLRDANVRVVVASVTDSPIDFETAKAITENNIYLFSGHAQPRLIHNPSIPLVSRAETALVQAAKQRFGIHKRIPLVLTESLNGVENLAYHRELKLFAETYEKKTFQDWDQEHSFVHDFLIENLAPEIGANDLLEGLSVLSQLDEISDLVAGRRPHFLHSFQTFLLGSLIIDKNYEYLNSLYANSFSRQVDVKIELPWFYASLFHDLACPFESLTKLGPIGRRMEVRPQGVFSTYVPHCLGCWFNQMSASPIDPEWIPELTSSGDPLSRIFSVNQNDHGVWGASNLIISAEDADVKTLNTVIIPAAFSISVHNSTLWSAIVESGRVPVNPERFPLAFLLLACDNIEEWGRERLKDREGVNNPKALIVRNDYSQVLGNFDLWLSEATAATMLKNRFDWINSRLFNTGSLRIGCSFYTD